MVTRELEAEEHGSKDRGDTAWWKLGCTPPNGGLLRHRTSQGPFGSPLPRWCMCQRGA